MHCIVDGVALPCLTDLPPRGRGLGGFGYLAVYDRVQQAASVDRTIAMATATVTGGHSHLGSRAVAKMTLGFDPPYPPWGMVPFVRRRL